MATLHAITPESLVDALLSPTAAHVTDGLGLYLLTDGKRRGFWRYEYKSPSTGKRTKLSFGEVYLVPTDKPVAKIREKVAGVGLAEVRIAHAAVREQIKSGIDPKGARDEERATTKAQQDTENANRADDARRAKYNLPVRDSFKDWAERYHAYRMNLGQNAESYLKEFRWSMEKHVYPFFGDTHITAVTSMDIAALDTRTADIKHARLKARRFVRAVFNWASLPKNGSIVRANPVYEDEDNYIGLQSTPRAAVIDDKDGRPQTAEEMHESIARLMMAINNYVPPKRNMTAVNATWLQCYTFQRSHQITAVQKAHMDLDAGIWTVPPEEQKGRVEWKKSGKARAHVVYLSTQAVAMLRQQFAAFPDSPYVFPGESRGSHLYAGAINYLMHAIGYGGVHTAHGFRPMARTAGEELLGINEVVLEKILAHRAALKTEDVGGKVVRLRRREADGGMPGVYDRTQRLNARQMAAQAWGDYIASLLEGASLPALPAPVAAAA